MRFKHPQVEDTEACPERIQTFLIIVLEAVQR